MKTRQRIFTAFILNFLFSVFEFIGGIVSGSTAIASDALHDAGDALGIGLAYFMDKKSGSAADDKYTYGYGRFSVLGVFFTSAVLTIGSVLMICRAFVKLIEPTEVHYGGVTVFAIVGLLVNLIAALITGRGESLSERAVRLHLIEDVLGWAITLIGAVVMHITGLTLFDALISIGVSVFILSEAIGNLKESIEVLLDRAPRGLDVLKLKERIENIDGVSEVISLRVRSIGEKHNHACVHILCAKGREDVKSFVRKELEKSGISDATIEL